MTPAQVPGFVHLLVTPFNVRRPDGSHQGLDPAWLDHRMPFFQGICAPSVAHQTTRAFRWIVMVDPETPGKHLRRINRALEDTGVDHEVVPISGWNEVAQALAARSKDITLSSRLDNDDALSRNHLQKVQSAVARGSRSVQFTSGMVLYAETGRVYHLRQRYSPYYSMLTAEGLTAATLNQGLVGVVAPPTEEIEMGFLRVLHGRNLIGTNGSVGRRVPPDRVTSLFPISSSFLADERGVSYRSDAARALAREYRDRSRRALWRLRRLIRVRAKGSVAK